MKMQRTLIRNWGLYPLADSKVFHPESVEEIVQLVRSKQACIARGNGRCYGDSSLSNRVISTLALDRILSFDRITGTIVCESGVLLDAVLKHVVPEGYFLPVSPGTKFITVGGALSSDIHGKNHHIDGVFSDHVVYFKIVLPDGEVVTVKPEDELFIQAAGGMGLTGIIVEVSFRLKPIETSLMKQRSVRAKNLAEVFELFEQNMSATYSVAWIDCMSRGEKLGRSVLLLGEHALKNEIESNEPLIIHKDPKLRIPFHFPSWVLNPLSIKLFNWAYYNKRSSSGDVIVHYDPYFYPLDKIHNWNRIYGKSGFVQYQFVLPKEVSYAGVKQVLEILSDRNIGSFLAVLKLFGTSHEDRYLHFPMKGYTLALDIKISKHIWAVLEELDAIVTSLGGKVYLTKDARLRGENFNKQYCDAKKVPANPVFVSHQQVRLQQMKKHVFLIIGANSDIAKQTALQYIKQHPEGYLILASRDVESTRKFISEFKLEKNSEAVHLDVEDFTAHASFYSSLSSKPNWVMYAAGVLYSNEECLSDPLKNRNNTNVNYAAPVALLNTIANDNNPGLERIIGMSSVAGLRGRKSNFQYGSAKCGFHQYLFGLRQDLKASGVAVQAITPGFVKTKMTAHLPANNKANMPEEVAAAIMRNERSFEVYPNLFWRLIGMMVKYAPEFLIRKL